MLCITAVMRRDCPLWRIDHRPILRSQVMNGVWSISSSSGQPVIGAGMNHATRPPTVRPGNAQILFSKNTNVIAPHGCTSMNKLPMTTAGHLALENELTHRIRAERPRLIQRIQEAIADDTNLAENSEYQAAKTEQERNEARIGELEDKLARAEIINVAKLSGDTVKFGATVTLIEEETGEKKIWQIVGEPEADAHKGKISVVSPIARALIGKSKGETIEVEAPGGAKVYKIQRVEWL
jgi:transcription elongation factor GreA